MAAFLELALQYAHKQLVAAEVVAEGSHGQLLDVLHGVEPALRGVPVDSAHLGSAPYQLSSQVGVALQVLLQGADELSQRLQLHIPRLS